MIRTTTLVLCCASAFVGCVLYAESFLSSQWARVNWKYEGKSLHVEVIYNPGVSVRSASLIWNDHLLYAKVSSGTVRIGVRTFVPSGTPRNHRHIGIGGVSYTRAAAGPIPYHVSPDKPFPTGPSWTPMERRMYTAWTLRRSVSFPMWMLILVLSAYPALAFVLGCVRRSRRRRRGLCMRCGYDLTGNLTGICPERGAQASEAE